MSNPVSNYRWPTHLRFKDIKVKVSCNIYWQTNQIFISHHRCHVVLLSWNLKIKKEFIYLQKKNAQFCLIALLCDTPMAPIGNLAQRCTLMNLNMGVGAISLTESQKQFLFSFISWKETVQNDWDFGIVLPEESHYFGKRWQKVCLWV